MMMTMMMMIVKRVSIAEITYEVGPAVADLARQNMQAYAEHILHVVTQQRQEVAKKQEAISAVEHLTKLVCQVLDHPNVDIENIVREYIAINAYVYALFKMQWERCPDTFKNNTSQYFQV